MSKVDFHSWHTLVLMAVFVGICIWAWSKKRKKSFTEAANLPFADEALDQATMKKEKES